MTTLRSFDDSLPMALLRAREAAMRRFRPLLAEHDLTEQQWRVLRVLASAESPMDVGQIADETFLLGPSLSRILAKLDNRGLVVRRTDPADHRRSVVRLSADGRRLFARIAPDSEQRYTEIEQSFGADRLSNLLVLLKELEDST